MEISRTGIPRFFAAVGRRRWLLVLTVVAIATGAAMLPAMRTMADHGASLFAFEGAASVERSEEILAGWGDAASGLPGGSWLWTRRSFLPTGSSPRAPAPRLPLARGGWAGRA
jgi:hypothetical protein